MFGTYVPTVQPHRIAYIYVGVGNGGGGGMCPAPRYYFDSQTQTLFTVSHEIIFYKYKFWAHAPKKKIRSYTPMNCIAGSCHRLKQEAPSIPLIILQSLPPKILLSLPCPSHSLIPSLLVFFPFSSLTIALPPSGSILPSFFLPTSRTCTLPIVPLLPSSRPYCPLPSLPAPPPPSLPTMTDLDVWLHLVHSKLQCH